MKKVFGVFLSLIVLMSLSACKAERPDDSRKPNPEELLCLTFVSSGESTIALIKKGEPFEITLEYSVDGGVWKSYSIGKTVILADGEALMFRAGADGNAFFSSSDGYYNFKITGSVAARGNIMSLLNRKCGRNSVPSCAFLGLFANCRSLTSAPVLSSTNLALSCYEQMFYGCTSLTEAPDLPATELAWKCYCGMFTNCTSLTEAPALPATELASSCYSEMFSKCTGLTKSPILPARELAESCYQNMFSDCTSLTKAPELPATKLAERCYSSMFDGCTSLTEAPALPATGLAESCYFQMFYGCTSLTKAPVLPATELAENCYYKMFSGCTSLTKAPALLATNLASSCYYRMFAGCTSLNYVKALFTDEYSEKTTKNWLYGVSPTGTFVKNKNATWDVRGASGSPEGWTVVAE